MNYKTALKSAGRFFGEVLLVSYLANCVAGAINFHSFNINPENQYLKKEKRKIVEKFIPSEGLEKSLGEKPTASEIVQAVHYQVQNKLAYNDTKRTLESALNGVGNCASYSSLVYAGFLNYLERHPELARLSSDVYMVDGINGKGTGHMWLKLNYKGEWTDIETTTDDDEFKIRAKQKRKNLTNLWSLLADHSDFLMVREIRVDDGDIKIRHNLENVLLPKIDFVYTGLNVVANDYFNKKLPDTKIPYSVYVIGVANAFCCLRKRGRDGKIKKQGKK